MLPRLAAGIARRATTASAAKIGPQEYAGRACGGKVCCRDDQGDPGTSAAQCQSCSEALVWPPDKHLVTSKRALLRPCAVLRRGIEAQGNAVRCRAARKGPRSPSCMQVMAGAEKFQSRNYCPIFAAMASMR